MAFVARAYRRGRRRSVPSRPSGYFSTQFRENMRRAWLCFTSATRVMCGIGAHGTLFALEQEGIAADITTTPRSLGQLIERHRRRHGRGKKGEHPS